jgi:hypothetical protein
MSEYGLKVKNSAGDIIIDSLYRNYAFYTSGQAVATWAGDGYTNYGVMVLVSFTAIPDTQMPLVAIQPATNRMVNLIGYHKTGSYWDGFYIQVGVRYDDGNWANATINYKVFVAGLAAASGTYGMRIYNASGGLIFDSNRKYFNIGQVNSVNVGAPSSQSTPSVDVTHPTISDPYYFISPAGYYHGTSCAGAWIQRNIGLLKLNSTSVKIGWNSIWLSEPEGSDASYNPTLTLITIPN